MTLEMIAEGIIFAVMGFTLGYFFGWYGFVVVAALIIVNLLFHHKRYQRY